MIEDFFIGSTGRCLVAIVGPLAIMDNIFRIIGLSLLANYVNIRFLLDGTVHDLGGVLFVVSIAILIVLLSLLRRVEQRPRLYTVVCAEV